MSDLLLPAPLWRRLAALGYDALLMIALCTVTDALIVGALAPVHVNWRAHVASGSLRVVFFFVGLAFFGWSWTHGGQTPGMRAWHIRVRSDEGYALAWPGALKRYASACLLPGLGLLNSLWAAGGLAAVGFLWCLFDPRSRAVHDVVARSEVVLDGPAQRARSKPTSVTPDSSSVGAAAESIDGQP